jgi:hypothetical protein
LKTFRGKKHVKLQDRRKGKLSSSQEDAFSPVIQVNQNIGKPATAHADIAALDRLMNRH